MKKMFTKYSYLSALLLALLVLTGIKSYADQWIQEEITEGKEYWFGLPFCAREDGEAIRGEYPIALWISSKVDTRATVSDAETGTKINVVIRANRITQVPYGDAVMNRPPFVEEPKNWGINITADDPISVAVYMSYRWSGEALRVTPVEWLGRNYYTLNLYQDKTDKYKPCQIVITATENNTLVTYYPTAPTDKFEKGAKAQVTLQKGQTYLILNRINPALNQSDATDLSGTYITSNKPISVISGHTKGAYPKYQATMLGRPGNFMRNMMTDALWPVELLGTEYISAPILYNPERIRGQIQDDVGDLIRFVATQDKTELYQMRQDGSGLMKIGPTINKGGWYDIINQDKAAFYKSNKPVIVGQYGKTWWSYSVTPRTGKDEDEIQNPSRNGQGMLLVLAPKERWTSYATFRAPEAIDNFVYITFRAAHMNYLKYDGSTFMAKFGNAIKYIEGTEYAYITQSISAGDHFIEGLYIDSTKKEKAVFAGYAYGNWDRSKDGFAYGYPIGINYNTPCTDSLYVTDNMVCGNVTGQANSLPLTAECAGIFSVIFRVDESENYEFEIDPVFKSGDKTAKFTLKIIDLQKPAKGVVKIMTRSGKTITKTYTYTPEEIAAIPTFVDFGLLKLDQTVCKNFTLKNPGSVPVTVNGLKLKFNKQEFEIKSNDLPVTLQPNETKEIEVCATAKVLSTLPVRDSVIAMLSCYDKTIVGLELRTGEPIVWIDDATWDPQLVGTEKPKDVAIVNQSNIRAELYSISWNDKTHFTRVEGLDFPLILEPREQKTFRVWYMPDKPGIVDQDRAIFTSNADKVKLYSDWKGSGLEAGPMITGYDWKKRRIIDQWSLKDGISLYNGEVIIDNSGNTNLTVKSLTIINNPDNVFSIKSSDVPGTLVPNNPINIPATFAPKEEKVYEAPVELICDLQGIEKKVSATLKGIGILPHIEVIGHEFQPPIMIDTYLDDFGTVKHVTIDANHAMDLTIFDLKIDGPDKDAFAIDQAWYDANIRGKKYIIPIGGELKVPIRFTAKHGGKHTASLIAESDAPDKADDALIGYGYMEGLVSTNADHGVLFKTLSNTREVMFGNRGTNPVTISRDIIASLSGDFSNFTVIGLKRKSDGETNLKAPFVLDPNDDITVTVRFSPDAVRKYSATIEYLLEDGRKAYSEVIGEGVILKTVARIPKGYHTIPGSPVEVSFLIENHKDELKALESANITEFKAIVEFGSAGKLNVVDVFPDVKGCQDIHTTGTMTEGWTCLNAHIDRGNTLLVHMQNNMPLKFSGNGGTLFTFRMLTFLSELELVPLPCKFSVLGTPSAYVEVEEYPGDIKIDPACVNNSRLIKLSGYQYSINQNNPNPAVDKTTIEYEIGISGPTTITLYNSMGEQVAVLLNQNLSAGSYEMTIDLNGLGIPSGMYQYKIVSGPFTEVMPMIVTR